MYLVRIYDVRASALPNFLEARLPLPSGLVIPLWRTLLADFSNTRLVNHLEFGWPLDYTTSCIPIPILNNYTPVFLMVGVLIRV